MRHQISQIRLVEQAHPLRTYARQAIAKYEQRRQLVFAHCTVRCYAAANSHQLSIWRPDPDRPGYELAACERCGAGASLHVDTARESISDALLTTCSAVARGVAR